MQDSLPVGNDYRPADGSSPAPAGPPLGGYGAPPVRNDDDGGKGGHGKAIIISIVVIIVVALIAAGSWFVFSSRSKDDGGGDRRGTESSQVSKGGKEKGDPAAGDKLEQLMKTEGDAALINPVQQSFDKNGINATVSQETHGTTISIIFTAKDDKALSTMDNEVKYMSESKAAQNLVNELSDEIGAPVTMRYISRDKDGKESRTGETKGVLHASDKDGGSDSPDSTDGSE